MLPSLLAGLRLCVHFSELSLSFVPWFTISKALEASLALFYKRGARCGRGVHLAWPRLGTQ